MKTRRAASLVELLLILSACTVVLTLTGKLLQRSMRIQMQSRAYVNAERTALRLADQFRRDAHRARTAVASDVEPNEKAFLRLEFAGGRTAEYSRIGGNVLRLESGGDKPVWREEFIFPAMSKLTIEKENEPPQLALTITNDPSSELPVDGKPLVGSSFVPVSLYAVAVVGRDLRNNAAPADQETAE